MLYLILCILCSSVLYLIFKGFEHFKINLLQAIVVNYLVAGTLGFILAFAKEGNITMASIFNSNWLWFAFLIGFMFITIFNLMGISSQKTGITITSIANKMSLVIPVLFGFFFFKEPFTSMKIIGIVLAIAALFFVTYKGKAESYTKGSLIFPIIIFFASGILDVTLSYCNKYYVSPQIPILFTACLFSSAAFFGLFFLLIKFQKIALKNVLGGIALGIPNFGSILFLFLGLQSLEWDVTVFFPVVNVGVVVVSALSGLLFFSEKFTLQILAGIILAISSILIIAFL